MIAETILHQLGGRRFIAMTGAKEFCKTDNSMMFRIPKAKDGINYVKIELNGRDLYDVSFVRIRGMNFEEVSKVEDIYCDMLVETFEQNTHLYTKLF